ncbi:MAG TPA: MBL fold metallo-hydrolase [Luteolibacter sp.]|nr:MBL fold metallo-hydrolase [Luteolibacter sp.]
MLEDDFTYVLRKALAGHQLAPADAAAAAGISERAVITLLRGTFDPATARRLAPVLGLNAEAFATHADYDPEPPALTEIQRLDLPFGPDQVNAWLVSGGDETILIDAGYERSDILRELDARLGRMPDRAFITHAHRDHVGALRDLRNAGVPVHAADIAGTLAMNPGDRVCAGSLVVEARDLCGHADPALGFLIHGLSQPVFVTGDALFAGSIGGCATPRLYQTAIARLRRELAALPDETVLLPGHGPATTLGQERARNPFL